MDRERESMDKKFKSGFCAIIGMPNVGKSTLLNSIAGQKIAIISDKPQTTRNKILAIYSTDTEQIMFTDTPGIHNPHNKLGEYMVRMANESMRDTDVVLFVVDAQKGMREKEREIAENIGNIGIPCILVINKVDLIKKENLLPLIADFSSLNDFEAIIPISAKENDGIDRLIETITDYIEEGPMFYDEDTVTDQPMRQIVAELIREKALKCLSDEIPHGIAVYIDQMKERKSGDIIDIDATIVCERDSHKGIIIGKQGVMLKKIGSAARYEIERMMEIKVNLKLWVKVRKEWRDSDMQLKNFGYDPKK